MRLLLGDCLEVLTTLEADSVDTLITDPPGGISFMGKDWDSDKGGRDQWIAWLTAVLTECYRVLKPGAMCLVWAIPRTSHWTGTAIENAGFQIRDKVYFLHGQGFPKGHDISKAIDKAAGAEREIKGYANPSSPRTAMARKMYGSILQNEPGDGIPITAPSTETAKLWSGYNVALKPSAEEWWLAMKPIQGTFAANALEWGVAGLNIDGCRVPTSEDTSRPNGSHFVDKSGIRADNGRPATPRNGISEHHPSGRWPSNVVHDGSPEVLAEFARYGERKSGGKPTVARHNANNGTVAKGKQYEHLTLNYNDSGSVARFFYCTKASKSERTNGGKVENNHPTVKPLALCRYLARLTKTPTGGVVLDPFCGSGSIGIAALLEGRDFIGIEKDEGNYQTAVRRIEDWQERIQRYGVQMEIDE